MGNHPRGPGRVRLTQLYVLAAVAVCLAAAGASGQVRIVDWNTATSGGSLHPGTDVVLDAIAAESINGIARPIDVLVLQEQSQGNASTDAIVSLLNATYGAGTYARAEQSPYSNYGMYSNIVYNTETMTLVETAYFRASGSPRDTGRYRLRPAGYGPEADVYIYNTHYKAGTSGTDKTKRATEAREIRWDNVYGADSLPADANIIYAGDYNIRSSYEDATMSSYDGSQDNPYAYMLAGEAPWGSSGNGQGVDPLSSPGTWHDSYSFRDIHTQAPAYSPPSGLVGGGMDDRFDFQLVSTELFDGEQMSYIGPGVGDISASDPSYRAFGNNGTHYLNGDISSGSGASPTVLAALETASDHLPVVADYQLPAILDASVGAVPARVIVGADLSATVSVENAAPVAVAVGADELDYDVAGTGDVTGSASGEDAALGGGNLHAISLSTASAGAHGGQVQVDSDAQGLSGATFSQFVSWDVLDHARASFASGAAVETLDVDFGLAWQGSDDPSVDLDIWNLEATADYTADLLVTGSVGSGDSSHLVVDVSLGTVQPGDSTDLSAWLDTAEIGEFGSAWSIAVADETLPGAGPGGWLTLNLTGTVATMGDYDANGLLEAADVDLLYAAVNGGATQGIYDLTGDDEVDGEDVGFLIRTILGTEYGDATLDQAVDGADLSLLAGDWQTPGGLGWGEADFTGDGGVDAADLSLLAENWQWVAGAGPGVPEPATALLLLAAWPLLAARRRRGRD